jgi:elongation factor P--(R)-beta-lysine ligase
MHKPLAHRARVLAQSRAFFESRGYTEVETPILVPSPGLDVHLDAFETDGPPALRYLSTSPEYQMKRLLVDESPARHFQITRAFRKGELGGKHNPEFSMLEFYRSPGTMAQIVRDTEQLLARITAGHVTVDGRVIKLAPPFATMRVVDAFRRACNLSEAQVLELAHEDQDAFFYKIAFEVEPMLDAMNEAVTLTHFPSVFASLARKCDEDPRYAERFEIYAAGLELCNGFGELVDPVEQRARFVLDQQERAAKGLPVYPIDEKFLAALTRGLPPCAGNAVGLDRLVALSLGETTLARVIAFTAEEV